MLLPLNPDTPRYEVLNVLNTSFLHFLRASITRVHFRRDLFDHGYCWDNEPTRKKFQKVHEELRKLEQAQRQELFDNISNSQDIHRLFNDTSAPIAQIEPNELQEAIKELTGHLFSRTKKLKAVTDIASQTTAQHYAAYQVANTCSDLCPICAMEYLANPRFGVPEEDQWIAAYDHLLCQKYYPFLAVHPGNILPTCHTCNSNAKHSKNLIIVPQTGLRRSAFYPYIESCHDNISVALTESSPDGVYALEICPHSDNQIQLDKISVWQEIYEVPARVIARLRDIETWIYDDCRSRDYTEFCEDIHRRSEELPNLYSKEMLLWKTKLYQWLDAQDKIKKAIWKAISNKLERNTAGYNEEYGLG